MDIQQNNLSKNNQKNNTSYILNQNEVYGDGNKGYNKYVPLNSNISAINIINNNSPLTDDISKINDIVYRNIQNGGIICEAKQRTNINSKMCLRLVDEISSMRPPFDYSNVVETEYYLLHGENSKCSKYWKDRHFQHKSR